MRAGALGVLPFRPHTFIFKFNSIVICLPASRVSTVRAQRLRLKSCGEEAERPSSAPAPSAEKKLSGLRRPLQPHQRTQLVPRNPRLQSALPDGIQGDMTANDEDHPSVQMDVPDISGADARPAQDIVDEMERIACGDKHDVSKGALYKKPAHCTVALKRPSASTAVCTPICKKKPAGKSFKLGCSRCRGSKMGCLTCRNPAYAGRRWQR